MNDVRFNVSQFILDYGGQAYFSMTKLEVLQDLEWITFSPEFSYDQMIIIGEAAKLLLNTELTSDEETINIWVTPKYYDFMLKDDDIYGELYETVDGKEVGYILFASGIRSHGFIKMIRGYGSKPKSKKVRGFSVQTGEFKSNIANFRVVK